MSKPRAPTVNPEATAGGTCKKIPAASFPQQGHIPVTSDDDNEKTPPTPVPPSPPTPMPPSPPAPVEAMEQGRGERRREGGAIGEKEYTPQHMDVGEIAMAFRRKLFVVEDVDEVDREKPAFCAEYAKDIYQHLRRLEVGTCRTMQCSFPGGMVNVSPNKVAGV